MIPVQSAYIIHKGEQFAIPFEVKIGDEIATPENINGLRIKVFGRLHEWPNGNLTFDSDDNVWLYPLGENQTRGMLESRRSAQVAVKIGENILKTDVFEIEVKNSIIMEPWSDG